MPRKDRTIISREPLTDIKMVANSVENSETDEMDFVFTHIPTGVTHSARATLTTPNLKKMKSALLAKVEEHKRKQEQRVTLTTGDLKPLRALHDKLHVMLEKDRTQADYEPTLTELEDVVGLAGEVGDRFGRVCFNLRHGRDRDEP